MEKLHELTNTNHHETTEIHGVAAISCKIELADDILRKIDDLPRSEDEHSALVDEDANSEIDVDDHPDQAQEVAPQTPAGTDNLESLIDVRHQADMAYRFRRIGKIVRPRDIF